MSSLLWKRWQKLRHLISRAAASHLIKHTEELLFISDGYTVKSDVKPTASQTFPSFIAFITKLTHDACMCVSIHSDVFYNRHPTRAAAAAFNNNYQPGGCGSGPLLGNIEVKRWCWVDGSSLSGDIITKRVFHSCWKANYVSSYTRLWTAEQSRKLCSPCRHFIWYQRSVELAF